MLAASLYCLYSNSCCTSCARVLQSVFLGCLLGMWQHESRFDFDQQTSNFKKVADGIHIQFLQDFQVFQILLRDRGDRDVADIQLLLPYQIQKQVQRAAVDV